MLSSFFRGFIKIYILHHAEQGPVYGLALIEALGRRGYALSPGTLYPALRSLEDQGYLKSQAHIVNGKRRIYYAATRQGRRALAAARGKIAELVAEVTR